MTAGIAHQPTTEDWERLRNRPTDSILSGAAIDALAPELHWIRLRVGEILLRQGEAEQAAYVVVRGRLEALVHAPGTTTSQSVRRIVPGEIVGELAPLTDEPRSATVRAMRETVVVRIDRDPFLRLLEQDPATLMRVTRLLAHRLRTPPAPPRAWSGCQTLVVIPAEPTRPAAQTGNAVEAFLGTLLRQFHEPAARVPTAVRAETETADDPGGVLGEWLERRDVSLAWAILVADSDPTSAWSQLCMQHADRILVVAGPDATPPTAWQWPEPGRPDDPTLRIRRRKELVLLHPTGRRAPTQTARWMQAIADLDLAHHVRVGHEGDHARVARFVTGRAIALVMSGGGARAAAHVGVVTALREAGVPIDLVGGTSAGSLVGGLTAMELPTDELSERLRKAIYRPRLFDFTVPITSLLGGKMMARALATLFDPWRIEDLWRPYFAVSSNLSRAERVVHRTGPLTDAVRTSGAIPGVLPPERRGRELLVDGVLMDNLPAQVARDIAPCRIIAVNLVPRVDARAFSSLPERASRLRAVARRINPLTNEPSPLLMELITRSVLLGAVCHARDAAPLAELFIEPPDIGEFGLFEIGAYDRIVASGYRAALVALKSWTPDP